MDVPRAIMTTRKDAVLPLGVVSYLSLPASRAQGVDDRQYSKSHHTATLVQQGSQKKIVIIGGTRVAGVKEYILIAPHRT